MTNDRTRYESHTWSPRTDDDEDECVVCGVTWGECEDDCPDYATGGYVGPGDFPKLEHPAPFVFTRGMLDLIATQPYQPNPYDRLMTEALNSAEETGRTKERRRWLDWLATIGYGQDFAHDDQPPCTPRELAEVLNERENLDADADGGQTGVDLWVWCIAENSGWERCGNCEGNPRTCECDES